MCFSENGANPFQKIANYGLHRMTKALRKMFFPLWVQRSLHWPNKGQCGLNGPFRFRMGICRKSLMKYFHAGKVPFRDAWEEPLKGFQ